MRITKPFRWYGGKGKMLAKLLSIVPTGGLPYVEPYAGSAALFFARQPAPVEVLNDIDKHVVNFYRVMQSKKDFDELQHRLRWTPFSRAEFARAIHTLDDPNAANVDKAWAFFVLTNQSMNGIASNVGTVGQWAHSIKDSRRGRAGRVSGWQTRTDALEVFRERLMRAQIENIDALKCIQMYDNEDAVFYVDPPYVSATRKSLKKYNHEADDDHHRALVEVLKRCAGAVVLSGYVNDTYRELEEAGWTRRDFDVPAPTFVRERTNGKTTRKQERSRRIESVWINQKATARTQLFKQTEADRC